MPALRRNSIPIIYTSGTHFEVGFDVGRTFRGLIEDFLQGFTYLHEDLLPAYNTPKGKLAYEKCLLSLNENYPHYVRELKGTAEGAKVPFHYLMLLHMDRGILKAVGESLAKNTCGCSSICSNGNSEVILGHTEDALPETLNYAYIISACIKEPYEQGKRKTNNEEFTAFCYAGHLPGFCMGYNKHGLIFSVNVLFPQDVRSGKTPRHFISRSLLAARNLSQAEEIMKDRGVGCSDGASYNMIFVGQDGNYLFHNAEIGPPSKNENESPFSLITINPGEYFMRANRYLRLELTQTDIEKESSRHRCERGSKMGAKLLSKNGVLEALSDTEDSSYPIFREGNDPDNIKTISVGLFDITERTWTIWMKNPKTCEPVASLPLIFKWNKVEQ